jgi:hypothetical protein
MADWAQICAVEQAVTVVVFVSGNMFFFPDLAHPFTTWSTQYPLRAQYSCTTHPKRCLRPPSHTLLLCLRLRAIFRRRHLHALTPDDLYRSLITDTRVAVQAVTARAHDARTYVTRSAGCRSTR